MKKAAVYLLGVGVLAGIGAYALAAKAEADRPPGEKAKAGDDAEFDLASIAGLLDVPAGASHGILHVAAPGPTYLSGTLIAVVVPDLMGGPPRVQPIPPSPIGAGVTIPKTAVVAVTRDGKAV